MAVRARKADQVPTRGRSKADPSNNKIVRLPVKNKRVKDAEEATFTRSGQKTIVKLTLRSIRPMLQDRMTEEALDNLPGGLGKLKMPNFKEMTYAQRANHARYHGPSDEFGVPSECLFACVVRAGSFHAFKAKQKISTKEDSMVPGFLKIQEDFIAFKDQSPKSMTVDKRRGVNPSTGGAMCIIRGRFLKWEADVTIEIDHRGGVSLELVRQLFDTAGREARLCSHRKKGQFGSFEVVRWQVVSKASRAA